jgi:hypothetical protein
VASERQLKQALEFIKAEGYGESIFRKHATLPEIMHHSVWTAPPKVEVKDAVDDLFDTVPTKKKQNDKFDGKEISLQEAMSLVKNANKIEVAVTPEDRNHVAVPSMPKFSDSKPMYRWDCGFGWTYEGGLADTSFIQDSVKKHGGNIDAPFRVSLSWFAADDLDLHLREVGTGTINFAHKHCCGWKLDVDMNAINDGKLFDAVSPIENIFTNSVHDGHYSVKVHQYNRRSESVKDGFFIEVVAPGFTKVLHYPKRLPQKQKVTVCDFSIKNGKIVDFVPHIDVVSDSTSCEWYEVPTILESPQESTLHHTFFVLDGYKKDNSEKVRGLFLEAMKPELKQHRKVLEIIGDKAAFETTPNGAYMLGVADNKKELNIPIKIDGRPYKIVRS